MRAGADVLAVRARWRSRRCWLPLASRLVFLSLPVVLGCFWGSCLRWAAVGCCGLLWAGAGVCVGFWRSLVSVSVSVLAVAGPVVVVAVAVGCMRVPLAFCRGCGVRCFPSPGAWRRECRTRLRWGLGES